MPAKSTRRVASRQRVPSPAAAQPAFRPSPAKPEQITVGAVEMARMLGVNPRWLIRSSVPRARIGKRFFFMPDVVKQYLHDQQTSASS